MCYPAVLSRVMIDDSALPDSCQCCNKGTSELHDTGAEPIPRARRNLCAKEPQRRRGLALGMGVEGVLPFERGEVPITCDHGGFGNFHRPNIALTSRGF